MHASQFEIYELAGLIFWRLRVDGELVATSSRGFAGTAEALDDISTIQVRVADADIVSLGSPDCIDVQPLSFEAVPGVTPLAVSPFVDAVGDPCSTDVAGFGVTFASRSVAPAGSGAPKGQAAAADSAVAVGEKSAPRPRKTRPRTKTSAL